MSKQVVICRETCKWGGAIYHSDKLYHSDTEGEFSFVRENGKVRTIHGVSSKMYKINKNKESIFIGRIPRELLDENFFYYDEVMKIDKLFNKLLNENDF